MPPVDTNRRSRPSGLDISKKGDLALVTNRADNSITVLTISGKDVKVTDTIAMGDSVAHVAISADGTKALAVKPVVNKVAFLKIDGQKVAYEKYDMPTGVFPYNVDIVPNGTIALVANNGAAGSADGNVDTVSVIDLNQNPPRVIDHVVVGDAPEGLAISPKGDLALDSRRWQLQQESVFLTQRRHGRGVEDRRQEGDKSDRDHGRWPCRGRRLFTGWSVRLYRKLPR